MSQTTELETLEDLFYLLPDYDPYWKADDFYFDEAAGQEAIDFIEECCTFTKGEWGGKPINLQNWQKAIIACLFGWKRKSDGMRRYREMLLYIPRKNGKTEMMGAIALYCLFLEGEYGTEIYSAASNESQAKIVWDVACQMILNEEGLRDDCVIYKQSIVVMGSTNFFKYITSEAKSKHGLNAQVALIDELHSCLPDIVDVLKTSQAARRQPLLLYMTTADFDRESICNDTHEYACKVRDKQVVDLSFLPVIFETLKTDDWKSPEVWAKANPNFGISVKRDYFEREFAKARVTPSYENTFKRLHLNMKTEQSDRWLQLEAWDKCGDKFDRDEMFRKLKGRPCYAALDLSSTNDTTCLNLIFPEDGFITLSWFWMPEEMAIDKTENKKIPYLTWKQQGFIETTPGARIDYNYIELKVVKIASHVDLRALAVDPWNAQQLLLKFQDFYGLPVVTFRQGMITMNEPSKRLEAEIVRGAIQHGHNPVMRWMAGNVSIQEDAAGNIKPDKKHSSDKIDGIVALIMAFGAFIQEEGDEISIYNTQDLDVLRYDSSGNSIDDDGEVIEDDEDDEGYEDVSDYFEVDD